MQSRRMPPWPPHWIARQLLVTTGNVRMHDVVPKLSGSPGDIRSAGGSIGADNDAVFVEELGIAAGEIARLREGGII